MPELVDTAQFIDGEWCVPCAPPGDTMMLATRSHVSVAAAKGRAACICPAWRYRDARHTPSPRLVAWCVRGEPQTVSFNQRDLLLYAVGIGEPSARLSFCCTPLYP